MRHAEPILGALALLGMACAGAPQGIAGARLAAPFATAPDENQREAREALEELRGSLPEESSCTAGFLVGPDARTVIDLGGAARASGLLPGDVLRSVDGRSWGEGETVRDLYADLPVGTVLSFAVERAGAEEVIPIRCRDLGRFQQTRVAFLSALAEGRWSDCVAASRALLETLPLRSVLDRRRICVRGARALAGGRFLEEEARATYELDVLRIASYASSPLDLSDDWGEIETDIAWLGENGFAAMASDLQARLDFANLPNSPRP